MVYHWVYISHCCSTGAELNRQISQIIDVSVPKNHSAGVTGALVCSGNRFAQYLEGGEQAVRGLRDKITRDPRHTNITSVRTGSADSLLFPKWAILHVPSSRFLDRKLADIELGLESQGDEGKETMLALFREFASCGS